MTTAPHRTVSFALNGTSVSVGAGHEHLLAALREELGVTSPKDGCSPSGQCGACTVLVDGKARVSCSTSLEKVGGAEVTTLEGFPEEERARYAETFAAHGALQCGFCTPGILVRVKALIDQKGADLDRGTIEGRLGAHLCRCTGYTKIIDAVTDLAQQTPPVLEDASGIGDRATKYLAVELALGDRGYVDDLQRDGLRRQRRWKASLRSSPPLTSQAISGSASSTRTGRCSSPWAAARRSTATYWPSSSPTPGRTPEPLQKP
jgi:xanthine dehydrogenase molybdenum-binding subunit